MGKVERERNRINCGYLQKREGSRKRKSERDEAKGGGKDNRMENVE